MDTFYPTFSGIYERSILLSRDNYPGYVSTSLSKAIWYHEEGAWVIGSAIDYSVYAKLENSTECPTDPMYTSKWFVYNSLDQNWYPDDNFDIKIECVMRELEAPYFRVLAANPVRFGGNYVGLYDAMDHIMINENSVYKHRDLDLYVQSYKNGIRLASSLDLFKDGWTLEWHDYDSTMYVWNGTEFVPEPAFMVFKLREQPQEEPVVNEEVPCKLQMSSDGPLGRLFPDQMGIYKLMDGLLVYNKPIWKHVSKDFYIRVDDVGDWFVSSVSDTFYIIMIHLIPFHSFSAKTPVIMDILENYITMDFRLRI